MSRPYVIILFALFSAPSFAAELLDGTWKVDTARSQLPKEQQRFSLRDGVYTCETCYPNHSLKADGEDYPVPGSLYFDSASFTIVDANSYKEVRKKTGSVVRTVSWTVSPDGESMTVESLDTSKPGDPVRIKRLLTRIGSPPPGSVSLSGSWRLEKTLAMSDNASTVVYSIKDDVLTMRTPSGTSFQAKLDGTDAPFKGDIGQDTVSVRRISKREFLETDKHAGAVIGTAKILIRADDRTAEMKWTDDRRHLSGLTVLVKQ